MTERVSKSYKDLLVWRKALDLVKQVYRLTAEFPKSERLALSHQIRRAAVSVPSNIAEGQARQHTKEFRQFLYVALGSLAELDTQLIIAFELAYIQESDLTEPNALIVEVRKMLSGLVSKLRG